jgi:hypothetical protein
MAAADGEEAANRGLFGPAIDAETHHPGFGPGSVAEGANKRKERPSPKSALHKCKEKCSRGRRVKKVLAAKISCARKIRCRKSAPAQQRVEQKKCAKLTYASALSLP